MVAHRRGGASRPRGIALILLLTTTGYSCGAAPGSESEPPSEEEIAVAREEYCEVYSSCTFLPQGSVPNLTLEECIEDGKTADEVSAMWPECERTKIELRECLAEVGCDGIYLYWSDSAMRPCRAEEEANSTCGDQ